MNQAANNQKNITKKYEEDAKKIANSIHQQVTDGGLNVGEGNKNQQGLNLGDETNATITVDASNKATVERDIGLYASGSRLIQWKDTSSNNKATVTYSGLKNSSYVDQFGVEHKIAKIVRKFYNFKSNPAIKGGHNGIIAFSNPAHGFNYFPDQEVTVTDTFYDEDGNKIKINDIDGTHTAYINVLSLNAVYTDRAGNKIYKRENANGWSAVEGVHPDSDNTTVIPIKGSTITEHSNGWLYGDVNNSANTHFYDDPTQKSLHKWDDTRPEYRKYQYIGAAIIGFNGSGYTLTFGRQDTNNDAIEHNWINPSSNKDRSEWPGVWALFNTSLLPQWKANPTQANYHYVNSTYNIQSSGKQGDGQTGSEVVNFNFDDPATKPSGEPKLVAGDGFTGKTNNDGSLTVTKDDKSVGTYSFTKNSDGSYTVNFTPDITWHGDSNVQLKYGDLTSTYTTTVSPVKPTERESNITVKHGETGSVTPEFAPSTNEDGLKNSNIKFEDNAKTGLIDPKDNSEKDSVTVEDQGTWTIKNGNVEFIPADNFVGHADNITMVKYDNSGNADENIIHTTVMPELITKYVNQNGEEIANAVPDQKDYKFRDTFDHADMKKSKITKDGITYKLVEKLTKNATGTVTTDLPVIETVYHYAPKTVTSTVKYVNERGIEIADPTPDENRSVSGEKYDHSQIEKDKAEITGKDGKKYKLVPNKSTNVKGTFTDKDETTMLVYTPVLTSTTKYVDKDGHDIIPPVPDDNEYVSGDSFNHSDNKKDVITDKNGKKWKLVPEKITNVSGKFGDKDVTTTYVYTPILTSTTEYVDENGHELIPAVPDKTEYVSGDSFDHSDNKKDTITDKDGKKWKLVPGKSTNVSGKFTDKDETTTYVYTPVLTSTTKYVDKDGHDIIPPVSDPKEYVSGNHFDHSNDKKDTITDKNGKKYKLVQSTNVSGKFGDKNETTTYVYTPVLTSTTKYVDENGHDIIPAVPDDNEYVSGDTFDHSDNKKDTITDKDGKKWKLVPSKSTNVSGKFGDKNVTTTYVYTPVLTSTTKYVDENGHELIPPVPDDNEYVSGDSFDHSNDKKDTITTPDGKKYKLVKTTDETGKFDKDDITTTYTYELAHNLTVHYVDENNHELIPKVSDPNFYIAKDPYDASHYKKNTITVNGVTYELVDQRNVKGNRFGNNDQNSYYIYREVIPTGNGGSVDNGGSTPEQVPTKPTEPTQVPEKTSKENTSAEPTKTASKTTKKHKVVKKSNKNSSPRSEWNKNGAPRGEWKSNAASHSKWKTNTLPKSQGASSSTSATKSEDNTLPQTGEKDSKASVMGLIALSFASLLSIFGLDRKKKN